MIGTVTVICIMYASTCLHLGSSIKNFTIVTKKASKRKMPSNNECENALTVSCSSSNLPYGVYVVLSFEQ